MFAAFGFGRGAHTLPRWGAVFLLWAGEAGLTAGPRLTICSGVSQGTSLSFMWARPWRSSTFRREQSALEAGSTGDMGRSTGAHRLPSACTELENSTRMCVLALPPLAGELRGRTTTFAQPGQKKSGSRRDG